MSIIPVFNWFKTDSVKVSLYINNAIKLKTFNMSQFYLWASEEEKKIFLFFKFMIFYAIEKEGIKKRKRERERERKGEYTFFL